MVGWLFADLMLLLAIIGFGETTLAEPRVPVAAPPIATATSRPSVTPTRTPRPTPRPVGVSQRAIVVTFGVPTSRLLAGDKDAIEDLDAVLRRKLAPLNGKHAGIVLTFGVDPSDARALALSEIVNDRLRRQAPGLTQRALVRDFVSLSGSNAVKIEVYLLTQ